MRVTVKLFARLRDVAGTSELVREVESKRRCGTSGAVSRSSIPILRPTSDRFRVPSTRTTRGWTRCWLTATRSRSSRPCPAVDERRAREPHTLCSTNSLRSSSNTTSCSIGWERPNLQSDSTEYAKQAKTLSRNRADGEEATANTRGDARPRADPELAGAGDPITRELAQEELKGVCRASRRHRRRPQRCCSFPRTRTAEERRARNRAGTGGDEAALFAGRPSACIPTSMQRQGWRLEVMPTTPVSAASRAFHRHHRRTRRLQQAEIRAACTARAACTGHRSQRSHHRSTATAAVLPEAEDVDIQINEKDLRIDAFCSSGPGGQMSTPRTPPCIPHIPSGVVVSQQDENRRSRKLRRNHKGAVRAVYAEWQAQHEGSAQPRPGTGERSEKIAPTTSRKAASPITGSISKAAVRRTL